jgi:hypothetical protein
MDDRLPSWICFELPPSTPARPSTPALPRKSPRSSRVEPAAAADANDDDDNSFSSSPCRRRRRVSSFDRIMQPTTSSRIRMKTPLLYSPLSPRRKRATLLAKKEQEVNACQQQEQEDHVPMEESKTSSNLMVAANNNKVKISPCCPGFWKMLNQGATTTSNTAAESATSPIPATSHQKITLLVSLCRQGLWSRALKRCQTHPHEAIPVLFIDEQQGNHIPTARLLQANASQELIFQPTALGLVCSANYRTNGRNVMKNQQQPQPQAAQVQHDNNYDDDDTCNDDDVLALIQALLDVCPEQVQCSQCVAGHTPLRDALKNPALSPRALALLLFANSCLPTSSRIIVQRQIVDAGSGLGGQRPILASALHQHDRDGLYPIDHAIIAVVQANSSRSSSKSVEVLETFLRHASLDDLNDPVDATVLIDDMANESRARASSSPLVRLFSIGHSTSACVGNSNRQHQMCATTHSSSSSPKSTAAPKTPKGQEDNAAGVVPRILLCTRLLLHANPSLIYVKSPTTNCLPIHVALRNYGNDCELMRELMDADYRNIAMRHRNHYGDLPLHVACSSGVPVNVLRLVLARTLAASLPACPPAGMSGTTVHQPQSSSHHGFGGECGAAAHDPLIWSTNHAGYTPVDLEWIRHIEAGSGFFSHRAFYPLDPKGVQRPRGRYDDLYDTLLRQAADQVLRETPKVTTSTRASQRSLSNTPMPISTARAESGVAHRVESDQVFGLLLHRIFLIARAAFYDSFSRSPFDLSGDILHQASALCLPHDPTLPVPILELILSHYPEQVSQRDHLGKLPLHHAVQVHGDGGLRSDRRANAWLQWTVILLRRAPDAAFARDGRGRLPLHCALDASSITTSAQVPCTTPLSNNVVPQVVDLLKELVNQFPEAVDMRDPVTGLLPFMLAASNPLVSLDMAYLLFRRSPTTFAANANLDI